VVAQPTAEEPAEAAAEGAPEVPAAVADEAAGEREQAG
jgi:hypothetical protein